MRCINLRFTYLVIYYFTRERRADLADGCSGEQCVHLVCKVVEFIDEVAGLAVTRLGDVVGRALEASDLVTAPLNVRLPRLHSRTTHDVTTQMPLT